MNLWRLMVGLFFWTSLSLGESDESILFMVDFSGSMQSQLPSIVEAIGQQADKLQDSHSLGLISFDGCGPNKAYYKVPLAKQNAASIKAKANQLRATAGWEDIVAALHFAKSIIQDRLKSTGECARVVLFTDYYDTCGNNRGQINGVLDEIIKICAEKEKEFSIDVITSSIDEEVRRELDAITDYTGGKTHWGAEIDEIGEAVKKIIQSYRQKRIGAPLTSKRVTETPKVGGGKSAPPEKVRQLQKQKSAQGKSGRKETKAGES